MSLHTFVVHTEDNPGVLNRVASLFRRRAYNIDSLCVGRTHKPGVSRMTIVVEADDFKARRIEANLYKLVEVLDVEDITHRAAVTRDLALIKVRCESQELRSQILQLTEVFRARVVDLGAQSLMLEVTGTPDKIEGLLEVLEPFGIEEMVQTGRVSMIRGLAETQRHATPATNSPSNAHATRPETLHHA